MDRHMGRPIDQAPAFQAGLVKKCGNNMSNSWRLTSLASTAWAMSPSEPKVPWQSAPSGPVPGPASPHTMAASTAVLLVIESDLPLFRSGRGRRW